MNARPKPGESEEEILKQQEEYLKLKAANKIKPSVTVESEQKESNTKNEEQNVEGDVQMQLSNTFEAIPSNINIGSIVENVASRNEAPKLNFSTETGFPRAKRRDCSISSSKGSIFAQQMKKLKKDGLPEPEKMEVDDNNTKKDTVRVNLPSVSCVLSGRDKEQIHKQNVEILKTMSETEILEEREKLMATMDPAIVAFLKSKRKELETKTQTSSAPISELNEAGRAIEMEEIAASSEVLMQPEADKWIHFDSVETSKLAWMKEVEIPKKQGDEYEARFDFAGWLKPFSEPEISEKNRILYHHGEEPGRPGYTLQELFQLARSSVIQQKIVALNTIANIFSLYSTGVYENVIDLPVEQTFFVVRMCLDDNTPSVLNAAIKAMRSLFFYEVDETCLSSILGFGVGVVQPILAVDEEEDDSTVNDQQLVETNLVKCLARTDILTRIRYIINTVRPATESVVYCLEILQRLVRDSRFIMTRVYNLEGLIKHIIEFFVPQVVTAVNKNDSAYGVPLVHAVKLLRLLSARSRFIATELIKKYKIMDSIATYLSNEMFSLNPTGLKLQTECLHLFTLFLQYNLALDDFSALQPIFLRLLDYHTQKTDQNNTTSYIMHGHVGALLILLSEAAKRNWNLISDYVPLLTGLAVKKWFSQTCDLTEFFCGKLQIISGLLQCLSSVLAYKTEIGGSELDDAVLVLIKSAGFALITNSVKYGSNVINDVSTFKSSANFKTLEAVAWKTSEHTVPVLLTKSCIPFLAAVSSYLINTDNLELKLNFLQHKNIKTYLQQLRRSEKYFLTTNWFTKIESLLIMNILKLSIAVQRHVDTAIFYELAVKCLNIFNIEQKEDIENVFKKIIFSKSFYPSEVLIKNLNITDGDGTLQTSLRNLEEVLDVYSQVLGLKKKSLLFADSRAVDIKIGNLVPVDWIYSPILIMYSEQQENKNKLSEVEQIHVIKNCLRWIYIYEVYFPELAACINVTDRFCRLACVFLASDGLFLEADIENLLGKCLSLIMERSGKDLNFNKPIQGLSNFQDFYAQLLEQYQGVSYGNILFGNVVLIPLAQRHNVKWRKTLWSEYAGVVQILNVTPEQCVCPLEDFLSPLEEDLSLLKCYRRVLLTGLVRKQTVLEQIANHHVESFVAKKREEKNKNP